MTEAATTPWNSEHDYRAAIDQVLSLARETLCVFDRDLQRMGLEEKTRAEALADFLAGSPTRRLQLVVHDPAPLQKGSPRLRALIRQYLHACECRQTPAELQHLSDCLFLADQDHGVIRFHYDHARGKLITATPTELAAYRQRFEDVWEAGHPLSLGSTLGL